MIHDLDAGYNAYVTYLAIKSHFSSSYDFFKYNGKIRSKKESFYKRRDKFFFAKLEKKYKKEERINYIVANFISGNEWIGNMFSSEGERNYTNWKKKQESLSYIYKEELSDLFSATIENGKQLNDLLIVKDHEHPPLLRAALQESISIEVMIILDDILNFMKHWNKELDDIIWVDYFKRCSNYKPFFTVDNKSYQQITKNLIKSIDI